MTTAERRQPPIYTNRYLCPITDCGWYHDEPMYPDGPWAPWQGSIEATVRATHMAQAQAVDRSIAGHLMTHPVLEWFREVRSQQDRAERAESEMERLRAEMEQLQLRATESEQEVRERVAFELERIPIVQHLGITGCDPFLKRVAEQTLHYAATVAMKGGADDAVCGMAEGAS